MADRTPKESNPSSLASGTLLIVPECSMTLEFADSLAAMVSYALSLTVRQLRAGSSYLEQTDVQPKKPSASCIH